MLVTLCKTGEVSFHLIDTNGFHVKGENERFTAAGSFCRQNFKFEIFMPSFGRLCQRNVQKCGQHVQHDYFSVFINSNIDFSGCRSLNPLLGRCFFQVGNSNEYKSAHV